MGLEDSDRCGAKLAIRSTAPLARVAPVEAVAEVVRPREFEPERRISVRVEVVAAGQPASAFTCAVAQSLPSASHASLESEAAQLTAATTAAALARGRGSSAYASCRDLLDDVVLARGVWIRVDA